jgi:hypothetical protein
MNTHFETEICKSYISAHQNREYYGNIQFFLKPSYYDDFINFFKCMKKQELIDFCEYYEVEIKKSYSKDFIINNIFYDYFEIWIEDTR